MNHNFAVIFFFTHRVDAKFFEFAGLAFGRSYISYLAGPRHQPRTFPPFQVTHLSDCKTKNSS
jgi:hypothetical protein